MEEAVRKFSGNTKFMSAFAQGAAGDVSPNYIMDKKKKWTRGKYEDDFESATISISFFAIKNIFFESSIRIRSGL